MRKEEEEEKETPVIKEKDEEKEEMEKVIQVESEIEYRRDMPDSKTEEVPVREVVGKKKKKEEVEKHKKEEEPEVDTDSLVQVCLHLHVCLHHQDGDQSRQEGENGLNVGQVSQSDMAPIIRRISVDHKRVSFIKLVKKCHFSSFLLLLAFSVYFSIFCNTIKSNHFKAARNCKQIYCKSGENHF